MFIEFKVANYRSIGEEQVLSLVPAGNQKEYPDNIIQDGKYAALNGIVLYGANGSGKSNLLSAVGIMCYIVRMSASSSSTALLPYDPFLLRDGYAEKDTTFEIIFVIGESRYRYGFSYNMNSVNREWLFRKIKGRETSLFEREGDVIDVSSGFKGSAKLIDTAIEATRNNTLFLSLCDMLNVEEAKSIMQWFSTLNIINGQHSQIHEIQTVNLLQNPVYKQKIKDYLASVCLGVHDIDIETKEFEDTDLPTEIPGNVREMFSKTLRGGKQVKVMARHVIYDMEAKPTQRLASWDWDSRESSGSQKAMHLSGPILWALANGGTLVIDEVEAFLHPIMTLNTIEIFLNKGSNPQNAQLIFATHDTNLLSYAKLRRDQIYFAEKNAWESTEIFSLSDFKYIGEKDGHPFAEKERPDSDKERRYIEGRYGAIPMLGKFNDFIRNIKWQNEVQ